MTILERVDQLAELSDAFTRLPVGSAFAVVGEAGAGKTSLVSAICAEAPRIRTLRVSADPLDTPRPLGPMKDLGIGRDTTLLAEVCERTYDYLRVEPTLLIVEDLHWVDAASVDVLRFLCRRIEALPLVLILTSRELEPQAPARALFGEPLTRIGLPPLTIGAVRQLLTGTGLDAERVRATTGGNPFFVTEVSREPDLPMPSSVRDAVLARTTKVTAADFEVLQLIAASPDSLADSVLARLNVDVGTLRRLADTGLVTAGEGGVVFRHELARRAIESTIPPGGVVALHGRLLDALADVDGVDPAVLTHHAVAAHDAARTVSYAKAAALEAIRGGAHTEAVAFYEIARDHLGDVPPGEHAALLLALAVEQYMVSRLPDAIASVHRSFGLWEEAGDAQGLAAAHTAAGLYEFYNAQRRRAEDHLDIASQLANEAGAREVYGLSRLQRAFVAAVSGDVAAARTLLADPATRGDELSRLFNESVADGTELSSGRFEARTRLLDHIRVARSHGFDELAATVYSNVAHWDVEHGRYRDAESVLAESLPFAIDRDVQICRHWQTSVRSRLQFAKGHWSGAIEDAETVLDVGRMPIAAVWPHVVRTLVPLRCDGVLRPDEVERAWRLTAQIDEPGRRLGVVTALAEISWMSGTVDERVREPVVVTPGTRWAAGPVVVWQRRLGLPVADDLDVAEPFRMSLDGDHAAAAHWWQAAGDPFSAAMCWIDGGEAARGVSMLDALGASGAADRARIMLREKGISDVPQRPRDATKSNPGGLTNRQLDVARLVARGLSNAEIAGELFISPKTTDHHVSAVLTKLGVSSRREVLARRVEFGLA